MLALYVRQRHVPLAKAIEIQDAAEALLEGREYAVDSRDLLTLARESGRTANDCEFVAVAIALGVRLVTSDRQQVFNFPQVAIGIRQFGAGA